MYMMSDQVTFHPTFHNLNLAWAQKCFMTRITQTNSTLHKQLLLHNGNNPLDLKLTYVYL